MAEIGHGYGSEYQLLRILGHHRNWVDESIKKIFNTRDSVYWFDYPVNVKRFSWDGEIKGIEFLKTHSEYKDIEEKWIDFWPQTGQAQNWDGICKIGETYVFIEAKAHIREIGSDSSAKEEGIKKIQKAFEKTRDYYKISNVNDWTRRYYQLANRIAFIYFLNSCGIRSKLLNIYFINGYEKRVIKPKGRSCEIILEESKSVLNQQAWEKIIHEEYTYLGINEAGKKDIASLFIDCLAL